ncbi:MAG: formylglycine-generating enzyme family protein [Bacteroides xylanisolvens]
MNNSNILLYALLLLFFLSYRRQSNAGAPANAPKQVETKTFKTFKETVSGISFKMIAVDGGSFMMGANDYDWAKPAHKVSLRSFYMGETEVTQALWKAMIDESFSIDDDSNTPVVQVSWNDCQEFVQKLSKFTGKNYRLPTEAEWEFAARGGNKSKGYTHSGGNDINAIAWSHSDDISKSALVKGKKPNELGIYDMSGNVCEWCSDWYSTSYFANSPSHDPKGPDRGSYKIYRGGSRSGGAFFCTVIYRDGRHPTRRNMELGLRIVCDK